MCHELQVHHADLIHNHCIRVQGVLGIPFRKRCFFPAAVAEQAMDGQRFSVRGLFQSLCGASGRCCQRCGQMIFIKEFQDGAHDGGLAGAGAAGDD